MSLPLSLCPTCFAENQASGNSVPCLYMCSWGVRRSMQFHSVVSPQLHDHSLKRALSVTQESTDSLINSTCQSSEHPVDTISSFLTSYLSHALPPPSAPELDFYFIKNNKPINPELPHPAVSPSPSFLMQRPCSITSGCCFWYLGCREASAHSQTKLTSFEPSRHPSLGSRYSYPYFSGEKTGSARWSTLPYITAHSQLQGQCLPHCIPAAPQSKDCMYAAVSDLSLWKMRLLKRGTFQRLCSLIFWRTPVCKAVVRSSWGWRQAETWGPPAQSQSCSLGGKYDHYTLCDSHL